MPDAAVKRKLPIKLTACLHLTAVPGSKENTPKIKLWTLNTIIRADRFFLSSKLEVKTSQKIVSRLLGNRHHSSHSNADYVRYCKDIPKPEQNKRFFKALSLKYGWKFSSVRFTEHWKIHYLCAGKMQIRMDLFGSSVFISPINTIIYLTRFFYRIEVSTVIDLTKLTELDIIFNGILDFKD